MPSVRLLHMPPGLLAAAWVLALDIGEFQMLFVRGVRDCYAYVLLGPPQGHHRYSTVLLFSSN